MTATLLAQHSPTQAIRSPSPTLPGSSLPINMSSSPTLFQILLYPPSFSHLVQTPRPHTLPPTTNITSFSPALPQIALTRLSVPTRLLFSNRSLARWTSPAPAQWRKSRSRETHQMETFSEYSREYTFIRYSSHQHTYMDRSLRTYIQLTRYVYIHRPPSNFFPHVIIAVARCLFGRVTLDQMASDTNIDYNLPCPSDC